MATMTITTTSPQDARIVVAFGSMLELGRNATAAEVKADVVNYIRTIVQNEEKKTAIAAIVPTAFAPS